MKESRSPKLACILMLLIGFIPYFALFTVLTVLGIILQLQVDLD